MIKGETRRGGKGVTVRGARTTDGGWVAGGGGVADGREKKKIAKDFQG